MRLHIYGVFALVMVSQCGHGSSGSNFRNGDHLDYREIARQNRITEQILQNYLEKKLFPHNNRPSKAPTIWEILPRARRKPNNNIQDVLNTTQETLESGESEQVSFYDDKNEITEEEFEDIDKLLNQLRDNRDSEYDLLHKLCFFLKAGGRKI